MPATKIVLTVDVGGSHVKILTSNQTEPRRDVSGPKLTPTEMVASVKKLGEGWTWDCITVGVPAPVRGGKVVSEPVNLGPGWVGFNFEAAFGAPTKIVNDAAMQALGSYVSGRMLFLGLGTGLGSAFIVDGEIEAMELGHLPFRKKTFEDYVGERGLEHLGKKAWRTAVTETIEHLSAALEPDTVIIGGGNAVKLKELPANTVLGSNENAFAGGFRLWTPAPRRRAEATTPA